jgi:hypothetical protein
MALRLADASSSLWPPDRKLMPVASRHAADFDYRNSVFARAARVSGKTT